MRVVKFLCNARVEVFTVLEVVSLPDSYRMTLLSCSMGTGMGIQESKDLFNKVAFNLADFFLFLRLA